MKLIEKLNGDEVLLGKLSALMYFMNKDAARNGFYDYLEAMGLTKEEWNIFKEWLNENGLKTYN